MGISIVVPVYNSEGSLPLLVERLEPVLAQAAAGAYEAILVDDGSRDGSWAVVERLAGERNWVRGLRLMRNYGQHNALLCGIRAARHETVITMDDDLQNPPEEIPALLAALGEGCDVVYGSPREESHGLWRDLASQATKVILQNVIGAETARKVSAFRAVHTELRDSFAHVSGPHVNLDVLLTWGTTRFRSVTVRQDERTIGRSNYTFRKLLRHAVNMLTGFSTVPLKLASLMGFAFALFGLALLAFVLGRYLVQGTTVAGFPFLASSIAIFSGAQLFALGIIGEYLARMYMRSMNYPSYTVRSTAGGACGPDGAGA